MSQAAYIHGLVEYREGDGPNIAIRPGPCDVDIGELDVTISWTDGDTHGVTVMPVDDFRRFVDEGTVELLDPPAA